MINDMQKKILVKAIEIGVESGEDALEILKSYPNLSIAEKQEIGKEVDIEYSPTLAEALTEKMGHLGLHRTSVQSVGADLLAICAALVSAGSHRDYSG